MKYYKTKYGYCMSIGIINDAEEITETEYNANMQSEAIDDIKADKLQQITDYDNSSSVNNFKYQGQDVWLDKATRVGLVNAANAEKALGNTDIMVGLGTISVTLPIDTLLTMLYQLESYALKCYNVTLAHKNAVAALTTIDEVNAYDITADYPEQIAW